MVELAVLVGLAEQVVLTLEGLGLRERYAPELRSSVVGRVLYQAAGEGPEAVKAASVAYLDRMVDSQDTREMEPLRRSLECIARGMTAIADPDNAELGRQLHTLLASVGEIAEASEQVEPPGAR